MLYEVAITTVKGMERKISSYLRRWLGLPKSLSSTALYGTTNVIQLPFRGLKEEFVVTHTREVILYRDSRDLKVSGAGIEIRTGRKSNPNPARELTVAEERLQQKAIVGTVASETRGLGYYLSPRIDNARGKERRAVLQKEVREGIEETRLAKMVGLSQLGAWIRWENYVRRQITWSDLWKADLSQLRFQIQAIYDLLPSPSNFHKNDTPACQLCGSKGTLQHLLSGCPRSLSEGRYCCRHDQVLKVIAEVVSEALKSNRFNPGRHKVIFVRVGTSKQLQTKNKVTLLSSAPDWQLLVDLERQMKFPAHIVKTKLRPDIVMFSNSTKKVILWELSLPWEENMESTHERKIAKYEPLVKQCRMNGWQAISQAFEVGCRGFNASAFQER